MIEKVAEIISRYENLIQQVSDQSVYSSPEKLKSVSQEIDSMKENYSLAKNYQQLLIDIEEAERLIQNSNSHQEKESLRIISNEYIQLLESVEKALTRDSSDSEKSNLPAIVEIRAGSGGEEAALFARDLFEMYLKFSNKQGWQTEIMSANETGNNGFKEVIFLINNPAAFDLLRYESGVHRVQRVPKTEASGRIHTSAASVVVYPKVETHQFELNTSELEFDTYRSTGPGGQSVNTTDSAVRVKHIPTGIIVTCQDNKSQHKNKQHALEILKAKLYERELEKSQGELSEKRKSAIKTGDRSDKIRTYNFPQNRVSDHRISKSWFNIDQIMNGDLDHVLLDVHGNIRL